MKNQKTNKEKRKLFVFEQLISGVQIMNCFFCGGTEKNYKSDPHVEFICGGCVITLAGASQDDLKRAHAKAILTGYMGKVSALESFLIPEGKHGKRPSKSVKRNLNRKRIARPVRDKKRLSQPVEA